MSADTPRRLGRGLEALISTAKQQRDAPSAPATTPAGDGSELRRIRIADVGANRFQPRRTFTESELSELEDEDYGDVADAVILWWREDDGDLIDALVDALTNLAEGGFIVLLTPKSGRDGHVDAADIQEAALTAGLHASGGTNAVRDWTGSRLVAPKSARR